MLKDSMKADMVFNPYRLFSITPPHSVVSKCALAGEQYKPPSEREGDRIAVEGACESSPRLTLTATERSCTHSPSVAFPLHKGAEICANLFLANRQYFRYCP